MIKSITGLDWDDISESAPAVIAMVAMPMSYSIADGIGMAFIAYAGIKLFSGQINRCPIAVIVIALIFALKFTFL